MSTPGRPAQDLNWLITNFVERVPDVAHAVVVSSDGLPLAFSAGFPQERADQLAAVTSGLTSLTQGASRVFEGGAVVQTVVEMQRGVLVIMAISNGSSLAVLAASTLSLIHISEPTRPRSQVDAASTANGQATDGVDPKTDQGQVAVPPSAAQDQRLPIFDSLESDWFRRSGKPLSTTRSQGAQGGQGVQGGQPAEPSSWTSPADEGWRAAQVVAAPTAGETTQAGLPRRVPRANLVPGSVGGSEAETEAPARSADAVRTRMAGFQRGVREGRAAAPQIEEP